jgi:DNA-binding MarR family transcriptional regulator
MNARQIDELLGTPARLAIVASLAVCDSLAFTDLGRETGLADGNLHVQTRKLLQAGYISGSKGRKGNRQVTCFALTDLGLDRFRAHVRQLAAAGGIAAVGTGGAGGRPRLRRSPDKDDSRVW